VGVPPRPAAGEAELSRQIEVARTPLDTRLHTLPLRRAEATVDLDLTPRRARLGAAAGALRSAV
jgi:hypothetical protein